MARTARVHIGLLADAEREEVGERPLSNGTKVAGYCGIASMYLEQLAIQNRLHPIFCVGQFKTYNRILDRYQSISGHSWIKYRGYIVDITASQFANTVGRIERDFDKQVYVCRETNPHFEEMYVGPRAKQEVASWYDEPLDELCEKTKLIYKKSI